MFLIVTDGLICRGETGVGVGVKHRTYPWSLYHLEIVHWLKESANQ